jgi:hypothetical protein
VHTTAKPNASRHSHRIHHHARLETLRATSPTAKKASSPAAPVHPRRGRHHATVPAASHGLRQTRESKTNVRQAFVAPTGGAMLAAAVRTFEARQDLMPDRVRTPSCGRGPPAPGPRRPSPPNPSLRATRLFPLRRAFRRPHIAFVSFRPRDFVPSGHVMTFAPSARCVSRSPLSTRGWQLAASSRTAPRARSRASSCPRSEVVDVSDEVT